MRRGKGRRAISMPPPPSRAAPAIRPCGGLFHRSTLHIRQHKKCRFSIPCHASNHATALQLRSRSFVVRSARGLIPLPAEEMTSGDTCGAVPFHHHNRERDVDGRDHPRLARSLCLPFGRLLQSQITFAHHRQLSPQFQKNFINFLNECCTGIGYKVGPRLRESRLRAPSGCGGAFHAI